MSEKEIMDALDKKFKSVQEDLRKAQESGASKDELLKLHKAVEEQGTALEDFIESQKEKTVKSVLAQFGEFLNENKDEIQRLYNAKSGTIEFVPKAVAAITTGSGSDIGTPPVELHNNLSNVPLRNDNMLLSLATVTRTSSPALSYTEAIPKEGDYEFVAEGGTKPQIDFKWENRFVQPVKAAAHEVLTEEAVTDVDRLMSVAETYLRQRHDLFKVNKMIFGLGTGSEPTGASVAGRTFVAGGMATKVVAPNFMDVVNAAITDIYVTPGFTDQVPYMANVVLVNPVDFFLNLVSAKDGNGLPLYPQAGLFNRVNIGGATILPWQSIPAGKILVADMTKMNIVNYVPFSIRIGWINDQFITNEFTIVGESRYFQYIKNLDLAAFIYDDIATIKTAITAP